MNQTPIAVSITEATRLTGLGRTSLYAAVSGGQLKTKKFGRRTLIETKALEDFIGALEQGRQLNAD